jgi:hypothetical protein
VRAGFDCKVTAGFLESGQTLSHVANAAAVIAALGFWYESFGASADVLAASLLLWLVQCWFAVRVAIDRSLFFTLAESGEESAEWLDTLLVDWQLLKAAKSRSMADRSRGALRLWRIQQAALVLQLAVLGAGMVLRAVSL